MSFAQVRNQRTTIASAGLACILMATLSLNLNGCGTTVDFNPTLKTPIGPVSIPIRVTIPKRPVAPKPDIENDVPVPGTVYFRGCLWVGYDTTGDDCPDWFYCPDTGKLIPGIVINCDEVFRGDGSGSPPAASVIHGTTGNAINLPNIADAGDITQWDEPHPWQVAFDEADAISYPAEYSFVPPALSVNELFDLYNVVFLDNDPDTPDEISSYFAWQVDPLSFSGTADVILHLTTDHTLISPAFYDVIWTETFIIDDTNDGLPGYMSVRAHGDLRAVLAWAADMGILDFVVEDTADGTGFHDVVIDQNTRELFVDGIPVGYVDASPPEVE